MGVNIPQVFRNAFLGVVRGDHLNKELSETYASNQTGITALAGGAQAGSPVLYAKVSQLSTVASANDSVQLPLGKPGMRRLVYNSTANAAQIFTNASEVGTPKINATAGATGVSLAAGKTALFTYFASGQWSMLLSA